MIHLPHEVSRRPMLILSRVNRQAHCLFIYLYLHELESSTRRCTVISFSSFFLSFFFSFCMWLPHYFPLENRKNNMLRTCSYENAPTHGLGLVFLSLSLSSLLACERCLHKETRRKRRKNRQRREFVGVIAYICKAKRNE